MTRKTITLVLLGWLLWTQLMTQHERQWLHRGGYLVGEAFVNTLGDGWTTDPARDTFTSLTECQAEVRARGGYEEPRYAPSTLRPGWTERQTFSRGCWADGSTPRTGQRQ